MALDLSNVNPVDTNMPRDTRGRAAADRGPNPWLDRGWLQASYDSGMGKELVLPGKFEEYQGKVRETGETVAKTKLIGDASEAVTMIREAADKLGLGVRVVTTAGGPGVKDATGASVKRGFILIQYLGQKRKAPRKAKVTQTA